jgi:hypothetical protein
MSSNGKAYAPANPHALSQLRAELDWDPKEAQQHLVAWIKEVKALSEAEQ